MKIIATSIASTLLLLSSSAFAYKDLVVANHTNAVVTAKTKSSACSSSAGSSGVLKPHDSLTIPQWVQDLYCIGQCDVNLYISNNCTGPIVASAHIKQGKGITSVDNHNQSTYRITGSGYSAALEGGDSKSGILDFLSRMI